MTNDILLQVAAIAPTSMTNGPGSHFTIWLQGCTLNCPGCFNAHTHDPKQGYKRSVVDVFAQIKKHWQAKAIRGVTFTGGEPLQQASKILHLMQKIKTLKDLGIILLTGFDYCQLPQIPTYTEMTKYLDLCIAGRFQQNQKIQQGLRGSDNKKYIFYSDFYCQREIEQIPPLEVTILDNGEMFIAGIQPEIVH